MANNAGSVPGQAKPAGAAQIEAAAEAPAGMHVRWKVARVKRSNANFCNVSSTLEEVVLNFGASRD